MKEETIVQLLIAIPSAIMGFLMGIIIEKLFIN